MDVKNFQINTILVDLASNNFLWPGFTEAKAEM